MRESKIQYEFIDTGFGFPVHLYNVPMIKVRGIWTPKINYLKLSEFVLKSLVLKKSRLTGNEIRFIRTKFEMTLEKFAKRFDVSHPAVIKWENKKDRPTNMDWSTEKDIRLFVYSKLLKQDNLLDIYQNLEKKPDSSILETSINIKELELV